MKTEVALIIFTVTQSQFCVCRDSLDIMACADVWPDFVIIFSCYSWIYFMSFRSLVYERFVKRAHVLDARLVMYMYS